MGFKTNRNKPLPAGCAAALGFIFFAAGAALLWFLGVAKMQRAREVRSWDQVPCTVQRAEVRVPDSGTGSRPVFETDVQYTYEYGDRKMSGTRAFDGETPDVINDIEQALLPYRKTGSATCFVNPANPEEAVLISPGYGEAALGFGFGGLFALVGLGIMSAPLLRRTGLGGALILPLLSIVFAGGGGTALWFAVKDRWGSVAERMREVPCTIVCSGVHSSTSTSKGRKSTTYRPDIVFRYEWEGRTWHSEWTDFSKNSYSTSSRDDTREIVDRHRAGAAQTCWVDPEQPWVAVLEKNTRGRWLLWTFAIIFGGLGACGLLHFLFKGLVAGGAIFRRSDGGAP